MLNVAVNDASAATSNVSNPRSTTFSDWWQTLGKELLYIFHFLHRHTVCFYVMVIDKKWCQTSDNIIF